MPGDVRVQRAVSRGKGRAGRPVVFVSRVAPWWRREKGDLAERMNRCHEETLAFRIEDPPLVLVPPQALRLREEHPTHDLDHRTPQVCGLQVRASPAVTNCSLAEVSG
jgi:hypothetical protein